MKIQKYNDFNLTESMVEYFINEFNTQIVTESNGDIYLDNLILEEELLKKVRQFFKNNFSGKKEGNQSVLKKIVSDLNLNFRLVSTFGFGIGAFLPIVNQLMKNMNLSSVELSKETLVLLTLTAISIIFLEEKNSKTPEEEADLTKDSKSMLEELRMKGIGDGIVKKIIKCLQSAKDIFKIIGKHMGAVVGGFMDMFAYSAIMVPIMTTLSSVINEFDLNLDTMPQKFLMLATGGGAIIAKHIIAYLLNKLKGKLKISDKIEKDIESEIETPTITKVTRFGDADSNQSGDLIKEQ